MRVMCATEDSRVREVRAEIHSRMCFAERFTHAHRLRGSPIEVRVRASVRRENRISAWPSARDMCQASRH